MPSSHGATSSMRVDRGSAKSSFSSYTLPHASLKAIEFEKPLDRYLDQDRDYKSSVVPSYDPYQEKAQQRHKEQLKGIIDGAKILDC